MLLKKHACLFSGDMQGGGKGTLLGWPWMGRECAGCGQEFKLFMGLMKVSLVYQQGWCEECLRLRVNGMLCPAFERVWGMWIINKHALLSFFLFPFLFFYCFSFTLRSLG